MRFHRFAVIAIGFALTSVIGQPAAHAAQITVFCSNGIKTVVEELVPRFEAATKHTVVVKYGLAAVLKREIESGASFDVAILTPAAIDDLIKQKKIATDSRTVLARTGLGLAVRAGAPKRDI